MDSSPLRATTPGLLDTLFDHGAMAVWEQARRARRALELRDVASRCALEPADALRAIDRLESAGLLERVAASRGRSVRWRATRERIVVTFDLGDRALVSELVRRGNQSQRDLFEGAVARFSAADADHRATWRFQSAGTVRLDPSDLPELARRVKAVTDFVELVGERRPDEDGGSRFANHALLIRVEPLAGPVLPQPDISFVSECSVDRKHPAPGPGRGGGLTARERDVADALVRGMTRAQVALALGVTQNTVGTLAARVYRKLGVRTRLELAHALRALGGADGGT